MEHSSSNSPTRKMSPPEFTIDLTYDTLCLYCYVHHVHLQRAMNLYTKTYNSQSKFTLTYLPYILQPHLPSQASSTLGQSFAQRFPPKKRETIEKITARMMASVGLKFSLQGKVGDSRLSHKLIGLVGRKASSGRQTEVVHEIMRRFFEEEGDITDRGMLIDVAVDVGGLTREHVMKDLDDEELGRWVEDESNGARARGIDGVPHMDVNGVVVDGCRSVEELFEMLVEIGETGRWSGAESEDGNSIGRQCVGGVCK